MTLETFLKIFSIPNIIHWTYEIPSFLFKPVTYFKIYIDKAKDEKILQALFYISISYIIEFLFSTNITTVSFLRLIIFDFLMIIFPVLPLIISNKIIGRFSQTKITVKQILAFILIYKSFLIIAYTLFFYLFVKIEKYEFYFLVHLAFSSYVIFIYFYSLIVFHNRIRYFFLGFLFNYFLLNAEAMIVQKCLQFDNYSANEPNLFPSDPIYDEFYDVYNNISNNFFIKPEGRLNLSLKKQKDLNYFILFKSHLSSRPIDTISEYGDLFRISIIKTKSHLDSCIKNLTFNRNKLIFKTYSDYCNKLIAYQSNPLNDSASLNRVTTIFTTTPSKAIKNVGQACYYDLPKNLTNSLDSAVTLSENLFDKSNSAETITHYTFVFLFYPADHLMGN